MTEGKGRGGEIGCDLREGKPSIFFAYVLDRQKGTEVDRRKLVQIVSKPREATTRGDVEWAVEFYRSVGALEFAQEKAKGLIEEADGVIEKIPLDDAGKEVFRSISRFMIDRNT